MQDTFDPKDIKKQDMLKIAEHINEFIEVLEYIMIIPDALMDECGDKIEEGIKRSKELVKKLKKGDRSVFKDVDDWNLIA